MSTPSPSPIAITGATGFLGRHIVARLAADHRLRCISRGGSAPEGHQGIPLDLAGEAPEAALREAFSGCELVVHAAGKVSHDPAEAEALWRIHVLGTERVLEAARLAGVRRVVVLGTSGTIAVSATARTMDEGEPSVLQTISRWPYYRSKWVAEQAALRAHGAMEVVSLNPGLLLGPGDDAAGASTQAVRLFLDEGMAVVPQGGPCFVDVRDVAIAVQRALHADCAGQPILLGGANWTWAQLFGALARITGRSPPRAVLPARAAGLLVEAFGAALRSDSGLIRLPLSPEELELARHTWWADWSRATRLLGFTPRDPLRTLEDTVQDILDSRRRGFQLYRKAE